MKTLLLNPPSFEGFDGGAGARYPATREITAFWYPTWLAYPAGLIENSRLLDAPAHGISPEETQRIFQPYHRVEQDRHKFPGLGLGLAVSKQIVEAHGGRIWVTSELGRGSIFHFLVPMAAK